MHLAARPGVLALATGLFFGGGRAAASPPGAGTEPAAAGESQVVGGQAESGFPSAGFLLSSPTRNGSYFAPSCGLTLIAPRAAVTAAHCVAFDPEAADDFYGAGFGVIDAAAGTNLVGAIDVLVHPSYDPVGDPRYRHDVAVLILDRDMTEHAPELPVLSVGPALTIGQELSYVGYGRTTAGDFDQPWTGGERKSAGQRVEWDDGWSYGTTGIGGGLCWGDSGGPLLTDTAVFGVLSDFDQVFDCQVGDAMIFTKLDAERAFLDDALAQAAGAPAPTEIATVTDWLSEPSGGGSYMIEWKPVRYAANLAAPVADLTLEIGETVEVTIELANAGNMPWLPARTSLAAGPAGRESAFANETWTSPSVAAPVVAHTPPEAVGTFTFSITAPAVEEDTLFTETFVLAHDGATTETLEAIALDIIVTGPPDSGGCGCGVSGSGRGAGALLLLGVVLVALRRRARS